YVVAYEEAVARAGPLRMPWSTEGDGGHRFWKYYLKRIEAKERPAGLAWERLVPLLAGRVAYDCEGFDDALMGGETYLYPQAPTRGALVDRTAPRPREDAVDARTAGARPRHYRPQAGGDEVPAPLNAALAAAGRRASLLRLAGGGEPAGDPFSLAAVLAG